MKKVELLSRKTVFDDFFTIEEARLRFERYDGTMSDEVRRLNFERGDSVAALLVDRLKGVVYLTEQFKYPAYEKAGGWLVDVVAGMIDAGETPDEAVRREIAEEAGFAVEHLEAISTFFVSPGGTSERISLYCALVSDASRLSAGGGLATEAEDIKVIEWSIEEFLAQTTSGRLQDAKTLVAGYWLKDNRARLVAI
jgi:ADP-ribose pyrophosphatase